MSHFKNAICILTLLLCASAQATTPEARLTQKTQFFLEDYCLDCHNASKKKGKVNLEDQSLHITTLEQAELWQKVLNSLNSGEMPPEDELQPVSEEKVDFLDELANTMVTARLSLSDSGGKITMRRLNRREYQNTIEHLTGASVDVSNLPADGGSGTFDTVGASLFISSDQFEQYLKIGRAAIDEAFERQAAQIEGPGVFRVEPETTVNVQSLKDMQALEDDKDRFMLWKAGVDKAAAAPENRENMARILKENPTLDPSEFPAPDGYRFYLQAHELIGAPDPKKFGFTDRNKAVFSFQGGYQRKHALLKHYAELPHSDRGTYLKVAWGIQRIDISPDPKDLPPGTYKLRVRAGTVEGSDPSRHFFELGYPQRVNGVPVGFAGLPISGHQVTGTIDQPEIIETQIKIGAHTQREFGIQEKQPTDTKARRNLHNAHKKENGYGAPPAIWIDWIELEGPIQDVEVAESKVIRVEPETTINPANENEIAQIEDSYARFTRWQKGVDEAAKTPANQAKITEIGKTEPRINHPIFFYQFANLLEGAPDPSEFGFRDSGKAASANPAWDRANLPYHKHYAALPHRDRGAYLKLAHGTGRVVVSPKDLPPGNYVMRVRVGAVDGAPTSRRFIQVGHPQHQVPRERGLAGQPISSHQVTGSIERPEIIEIPLEVGADTAHEFALQEKQPNNGNLKALWDAHNAFKKENGYGHPPAIWIDWVELEGPINTSSTTQTWKQRREVEEHANSRVGGTYNGYYKGGYEAAQEFLKTGKPSKEIPDEQEAKFRTKVYDENAPTLKRYLDHSLTKTGSFLSLHSASNEEVIALPPEHPSGWLKTKHDVETLPAGAYKLRFRIGAVEGTDTERHFVELGSRLGANPSEFNLMNTFQISGSTDAPQTVEVSVNLSPDGPRKFVLREKRNLSLDTERFRAARKATGLGPDPALWIDWVEWEGPITETQPTAALLQLLAKHSTHNSPSESARARGILTDFAQTSFRQAKPDPKFIDQLLAIFVNRRNAGEPFDLAIRTPLSVILASPGFIYLNEPGNDSERRQLNDRELAVRLAYFLWSAPPDAQLLELAERNKLSNPQTLRGQVDRMITDTRSDAFVSGFIHQWLDMERLDFFQFDVKLHREFDESTRAAARQEVYQSFAHLLRDQNYGQLGKLLKTDYIIINGLLATYYGIEGVTGDEFRKVTLPADSPRGGLLGMIAIHAMGSDGVNSSPVERGSWVLRKLLNNPPPPAPANVPQLSRLADEVLTTRERLTAHMEEAQCASCHRKIDPIGFGLENFNAAGKWRDINQDGKGKLMKTWEIDSSGAFHNGPTFSDYRAMRDLIAAREDDFAQSFTEALIAYALGRPFGFSDEKMADDIVAAAKARDYSVNAFIQDLVLSKPFNTK